MYRVQDLDVRSEENGRVRGAPELTGAVYPSWVVVVHGREHLLARRASHQQPPGHFVSSGVISLEEEVSMASVGAVAAQMERMSSPGKPPPCKFPKHP